MKRPAYLIAALVLVSGVALYAQQSDAQKIEQAQALIASITNLTDTGKTNQKNILTRLETLKGQLVAAPEPTPEPEPAPSPVYVLQSVFDAAIAGIQARLSKLEAAPTPTPIPEPEPVPTPTPTPEPTPDPIVMPPVTGSHGYFDALCGSAAAFKCYSFRGASQFSAAAAPWVTYDPANDTDPQRQDGVKVRIPVWYPSVTASLRDAITSTQTVFAINRGGQNFENGLSYLVGSEIMTQVARTDDTVTVTRGQFGTAAVEHPAGTVVQRNTNSLPSGTQKVDIQTDGSISATYLLTWDAYWTDSYVGAGLHNHKSQQIASWKDGNQWVEVQSVFSGPPSCCPNPEWSSADVAATTFRWYGQSFTKGFVQTPGQPMVSPPWVIRPNTWTRFWVLVEANAETDHAKFQDVTTLTAAVPDADATVITVAHDFGNEYNPLTSPVGVAEKAGVAPGRAIRIGSEVMTIVSGDASGLVRSLTVRRGQQGTTATAHASGAAVQAIDDYVTIWMADEDNTTRKLYDRVSLFLPIDAPDPTQRGALGKFWIEFNTSTQQLPAGRAAAFGNARNGDLVAYLRNLAVLKNPGDVAGLLQQPVK